MLCCRNLTGSALLSAGKLEVDINITQPNTNSDRRRRVKHN
jgi:hypothetical protein